MLKKFSIRRAFAERRERPYILPTAPGWLLFAYSIIVLLVSAVYSNPAVQQFGFFLLGLFALAMTWTHAEIRGFRIVGLDCESTPRETEGSLSVRWDSRFAVARESLRVQLRCRREGERRPRTIEVTIGSVRELGQGTSLLRETWHWPRGHWFCERVTLLSRAPFGLFRVWRRVPITFDFWIYPELRPVKRWTSAAGRDPGAQSFASEEDFSHLVEGDFVSSSARVATRPPRDESRPLLKVFASQGAEPRAIRWSDLPGTHEEKLSQLTSAAWDSRAPLNVESPYYSGTLTDERERERALRSWAEASGGVS